MTQFYQQDERLLTPKDVQNILGTYLRDCLGSYTFKNGHYRVAISVNKRTQDVKVSGLECVIKQFPTSLSRYTVWEFYLIDHDESSDAMFYCAELLRCRVRDGGNSRIRAANYDLKQLRQAHFQIPLGELYSMRKELGLNG